MTELEHAIKHIKTRADAWAVKEVTEALQSISERLDKALSQEPKSGKWIIDLQTATEDYYICSECGRKIHLLYPDIISNYPYCHCGARMESEVEE